MGTRFDNNKFDFQLDDLKVAVTEHTVNGQQVFRLVFGDNRSPLIISRAKTWNGEIWTSIPRGRQKEAEEFGKQISKHLKD
jgi:hypothetical protein